MKKIILSLFGAAVLSVSAMAEGFEGTITYKLEVKGENAALFSAMFPNSIDVNFLGQDVRVHMNGGMAAASMGDIITKGAEKMTYMVMPSKKTVYKMGGDKKDKTADKPTITEQGTETVNGYNCKKYLVKFPVKDDKEVYQYMWCTNDLNIAKPENVEGSDLFVSSIEGFPVKTDMYITAMGMTINVEKVLDKISKEKPDASLFEIPKNYKVEDFDQSKLAPKGK